MSGLGEELSSLKRSAIVLVLLGDKVSQRILSHLKDSIVRKLILEMRSIKKVPIPLANFLLKEFYRALSEADDLLFQNENFFFHYSKNQEEKRNLLNYARKLDSSLKER